MLCAPVGLPAQPLALPAQCWCLRLWTAAEGTLPQLSRAAVAAVACQLQEQPQAVLAAQLLLALQTVGWWQRVRWLQQATVCQPMLLQALLPAQLQVRHLHASVAQLQHLWRASLQLPATPALRRQEHLRRKQQRQR